jgi:hypothetical protein
MKTFNYSDYDNNWSAFVSDFNQELKTLELPIKFDSRIYGPGEITLIRAKLVGSALEVTLTYENKKKQPETRELRQFLDLEFITVSDTDRQLLLACQSTFREVFNQRIKLENDKWQQEAAERRARQAELEKRVKEHKAAEAKAKRIKKNTERLEESKAAYLEKFRELLATKKSLSFSDEFYYSLGWLAKHSGTVKAVVPDICEAEFVQYFGTEVPFTKTEYKVGPGGWISQWGKSFTASLVRVKTIPAYLEQYLNPKRTQVTNSEYIKDLVDNYGFQFGKEQNVEAIRKSVPAEYLPHFEAGFAA